MAFSKLTMLALLALGSVSVLSKKQAPLVSVVALFHDNNNNKGSVSLKNDVPTAVVVEITNEDNTDLTLRSVHGTLLLPRNEMQTLDATTYNERFGTLLLPPNEMQTLDATTYNERFGPGFTTNVQYTFTPNYDPSLMTRYTDVFLILKADVVDADGAEHKIKIFNHLVKFMRDAIENEPSDDDREAWNN